MTTRKLNMENTSNCLNGIKQYDAGLNRNFFATTTISSDLNIHYEIASTASIRFPPLAALLPFLVLDVRS